MIRTILVDDEQKSIKILELLLTTYCRNIFIIDKANSALEAVKLILVQKPDLVFLDVQMPGFNGFDVLEQIQEINTKVIFTTAHKDYVIDALRKGAFDYLLKPIDINDLQNCIIRLEKELSKSVSIKNQYSNTIEIAVKNGIIFIKTADIIYIEASGSYTTFYLEQGIKHIGSKNMKDYETLLDHTFFYRTHNSYIANLKKVARFISADGFFAQMNDGTNVQIARRNKDEFLERLKTI
jgi:two-component system, LytTR family, response regulator